MKKFSTKRVAALGMTSALALGGLVATGVDAPANAAASGVTQYSCAIPAALGGGAVPAGVVGNLNLPTTVQSGASLGSVSMTVTLLDAVIHNLATALHFTKLGGSVTNAALPLTPAGSIKLGTLSIPSADVPAAGSDMNLTAAGNAGRAPLPGTYAVKMPTGFTFTPVSDSPIQTGPLACTLTGAAGTFGTLKVVKATSATTAKLANAPALTTKHAKIATTVKAAGFPATGSVVAMEGTKQLGKAATLKSGKATLVLPLLKKGAHTIKVVYKGTKANKASSKSVSFTVKRG